MCYGGDFGDRPSDYEFSGDGLLFADRTPSPKATNTFFNSGKLVEPDKTLILDLRPVEGSMPICSRCRHKAPLVHGYVSIMFTHCLGMRMQQLRLSRQLLGRGGIGNLARLLVVGIRRFRPRLRLRPDPVRANRSGTVSAPC